jgi:hypothetical protein
MYGPEYIHPFNGSSKTLGKYRQEAAGNINITKKIKCLIPTTCLSDVRDFEAKS